jgi:hypothetical protein
MTITRHASAGARRTWFRRAPRCLLGTTAFPDAAPARRRWGNKHVARIAAAMVAAGGASVGIRPMLATAYAANAVLVSRRGTEPRRARPCSPADPATRRHQDTPVPKTNPPSAPPGNRAGRPGRVHHRLGV